MSVMRRTHPAHFERIYRADPDPWGYATGAYEHEKYRRTLAAIGPGPFPRALELGCSIGVFTGLLAPRCGVLLAVDAAPTAVAAAGARLRGDGNVRIERRTLPEELPAGPFALIVASELLYYWDEPLLLASIPRLAGALAPGGRLVAVHWRGELRDGPLDGDRVHALLGVHAALAHTVSYLSPAYRLDRFDRLPTG